MSMIGFPLLLIPLAIYNIFAFLMPGVALTSQVVSVPLLSRAPWVLTFGDVLLALGIILVMFEVVKAARPGAKYLTDHLLSFLVLAGALAEFLLLPAFATSTFFLLTVLAGTEFFGSMLVAWRRHVPQTAQMPQEQMPHERIQEPTQHELHPLPHMTPPATEAADTEAAWQRLTPAVEPAPAPAPTPIVKTADAKPDDGLSEAAAMAASIAAAPPESTSASVNAPADIGSDSDEKDRPVIDGTKP